MIFLKSIYSEPMGLFDKVDFRDGINVILGSYSDSAERKDSLNSIGKTTLVNLVDFCLLGSYTKESPLKKAQSIMDGYYIVLEFERNNELYIIKRTTSNPNNKVFFGKKESGLKEYKLKELAETFLQIFFDLGNDSEKSSVSFRQLINFFIRDEKTGYSNEVYSYMKGPSKSDMISLNLRLLGLDSKVPDDTYNKRKEIKKKKEVQLEIKKLMFSKYNIKNMGQLNNQMDLLDSKVREVEEKIKDYQLVDSYTLSEQEADELTKNIKSLLLDNYKDNLKLSQYKESIQLQISFSIDEIQRMYSEVTDELGIVIKKTIEDAIKFRLKLQSSREKFLKSEIDKLESDVEARKDLLAKMDLERSNIYKALEAKGAIKDLTEAIDMLNVQKEQLMDLNGKSKIYNDLKSDILTLEAEEATLNTKVNQFIDEYTTEINAIRKLFINIYSKIYNNQNKGYFDISYNPNNKSDYRVSILANIEDSTGWGKGRGCVLIYDLTVLFNAMRTDRIFPRFLIHDGIYNGVDASQWVSALNYLNKLERNLKFQYFFTMNESETWIDEEVGNKIGHLEFDLRDKIIAEYSEKSKIFKQDYK